ncbi:U3 small nucleolar RNA-associated protein 15 homolog [Eleutherodactylus coqui]|uniref:U3 small nucleolar RNA-associated protein 15 homolog n=1 Tax=Eleutherodactylus coqui TaxID=57060 RepID=UPI003462E545
MSSYKPLAVPSYPKLGEKITQDTLYWKRYKTPVQIKEFGAVTKIDFSPVEPCSYAVTASTRIHIYGKYSQEPIKTFSRFKDTAYCGTFRGDGRLIAAGCEDSVVQLFDISGKAALRQFTGHSKAVHFVDFTADKFRMVSGSDDYTCKIWDVPNGVQISSFKEHTDYVRCGCTSKLNEDLFVTGSYDHTVKVFDARTRNSVMTIQHENPVESVLLFPTGGLLFTASGRYVKVWNMLSGGRLMVSLKNHHKTVTSLCLSSSRKRLLSASLDRHVKVYSTESYKVVHSFDYADSILSLALAPMDQMIVVGMTNSILNVKHRKSEDKSNDAAAKKHPRYRMFVKRQAYTPKQDDFIVSQPVKQKLKRYDALLRGFQVSAALDAALSSNVRVTTPEVTVAVINEIDRRGTLDNALAGRTEAQLSTLLTFIIKHVIDPRFTQILINVAEKVIDIYSPIVTQSPVVDKLFLRLQSTVESEINYQEELLEVLGMVGTLFASMPSQKSVCPERPT